MLSKGAFRNHDKADRVFALVRLLNDSVNETMRNFKDNLINYHISAEQIYRLKIKQIDQVYLKNFQNYYEKFSKLLRKIVSKFDRKICATPSRIAVPDALPRRLIQLPLYKSQQLQRALIEQRLRIENTPRLYF